MLHDIGKLVIPSHILGKPGGLTDEEFGRIKTHPAQGAALLQDSPVLHHIAPLVRGHHERYDGTGYPDGLQGDEISLLVAIISVCDAWDAMTNDRHYQRARSHEGARAIMLEGAGSQWHPDAVRLLLAHLDDQTSTGTSRRTFQDVGTRSAATQLPPVICEDALPTDVVPSTKRVLGTRA